MFVDEDDGYPGVDRHSCQLMGPTALVVQALMGVFVICSLAYKRQRETPKRPWRIWLFDVSKQIVGQLFVHGANVFISDVVADLSKSNACVFYFLNILLDTTLGVALLYFILQALTYMCTDKFHLKGFESGKYGNPPSFKYWARQASIYVVALTSMKFLVILLLALFPGLNMVGAWLLSWTWTSEGDSLQVVFTMGIFPIIMNVLQFWLIDSIVKAKVAVTLDEEVPDAFHGVHPEQEPLFDAPSDDDETPHVHDVENHRTIARSRSPVHTQDPGKTVSGLATPHEGKSSGSSTPGETLELHNYPPSVSHSSHPSSSSKPLKEATKLNKKRSPKSPNTLTMHSPTRPASSRVSNTSRSNQSADEWENSWEDEWENRNAHLGNNQNTIQVGS